MNHIGNNLWRVLPGLLQVSGLGPGRDIADCAKAAIEQVNHNSCHIVEKVAFFGALRVPIIAT
jgi:hypothetical protein